MLNQILNHLRGQVRVRVEAAFPERVLNLCGERNVAFWDLAWESETAFTCRVTRRDLRTLRRAGRNTDCTLTVVEREGVPYFLGRFRRRHVLVAGLALCAALLLAGSFFIWDFQVEGNRTVSEEEILRALEKNGVGIGTFGFSLDGESIRNHVLLDVPELSWISVNVSGCRAYVQVRERVAVPERVDEKTPTNVVARRAGVVRKVQALEGVKCVLPGTSVEAGQLLISGVEDTENFGARILAGRGSVTARTWYTLSAVLPLEVHQRRPTGEEKTAWSLVFGTHRVKFFRNSSIEGQKYDKMTERFPLSFFGLRLPVTLVREVYRFYEPVAGERTAEEARAAGEALLTEYLHTLVDPYGTVGSTLCSARERDGALVVTLSAECEEEIGQTAPIYTDTNEPGP